MNHTHTCQWCSQSYPGTTLLVEGETEDGRPVASCECQVTDECPGCSEHGACEDCGKAPAGDERDLFRCKDCADKTEDSRNERAYESMLSDFYGGSGPVTVNEFCARAAADKARGR